MKKLFEIVWCFIDKDNLVEVDDWGDEVYHLAYIKAKDEKEAIEIWKERKSIRMNSEIYEVHEYEFVR